jgi:hypothetical protein
MENYKLREELKALHESMEHISNILYCIGGPLNDNAKRYSNEQLKTFFNIGQYIHTGKE